MTFSLNISLADLLLLLPEIFLTTWLCVVLIVDFAWPHVKHEQLAYLSIAGLLATLACLGWFDFSHISGALFGNMFVLDRMALFFKMFVVGATILVILTSIDYVNKFTFFRGEYYFLVIMSAIIGMAVGGWMTGAIFDLTSSYQAAIINGVVWNVLNIAIALWLWRGRG